MDKIVYATGNKLKIDLAKKYLEPEGIKVIAQKYDIPEVQADEVEKVAIYSSKIAHSKVGGPVIKNDCAFYIDALNGFPGVYANYVERTLGAEGILKLLEGNYNRRARFTECYALTLDDGRTITSNSVTEGVISFEMRGTNGEGYDMIFIPEGRKKTLGEMDKEENLSCWDDTGLKEMVKYIKEN